MSRTLTLALCLAVAVALCAWFLARGPAGNDTARVTDAAPDRVDPPAPEIAPTIDGTRAEREAVAATAAARPSAPSPAVAKESALAPASRVAFTASFTLPDGRTVAPEEARVEVRASDGSLRTLDVRAQSRVSFASMPPGRTTVSVRAAKYRHRDQVFDLEAKPPASSVEERIVLWAERWIEIVVRTSDGRPFDVLAAELGLEPRRLFVGAFDAVACLQMPAAGELDCPESLALFHPPPQYQTWRLLDASVGSLELLRDPPVWVGLRIYGKRLGWEELEIGQDQVVFRLDRTALEQRFASVRLRVVDAGGAPIGDARVTLRADVSAHRRKEQEGVAPASDGQVEFERVVPGRYELNVERGDLLVQRYVDVAAGERRDLGNVELSEGVALEVRTVDPSGKPVAAWIEIGPYEPGRRVAQIYPPMLHWRTDETGKLRLPRPGASSVVRAATEGPRSMGRVYSGPRSANAIVEPAGLPASPLEIVLREPVQVRFESARSEIERVEILDALEVVVDWQPMRAGKAANCPLVRGRYRARFVAGGIVLGEAPFDVGDAPATVTWN